MELCCATAVDGQARRSTFRRETILKFCVLLGESDLEKGHKYVRLLSSTEKGILLYTPHQATNRSVTTQSESELQCLFPEFRSQGVDTGFADL